MASGRFHLPAPWTHRTCVAWSLATSKTSVWLRIPNWLEAATRPGRAKLAVLMANGAFHLPAP